MQEKTHPDFSEFPIDDFLLDIVLQQSQSKTQVFWSVYSANPYFMAFNTAHTPESEISWVALYFSNLSYF